MAWGWCERAHRGLLIVFLHSSDKGFWAYLRDLPQCMTRLPGNWGSLWKLILKYLGLLHSSAILGSDTMSNSLIEGDSINPTYVVSSRCLVWYLKVWCTGMAASSTTFRPHLGQVIRYLCCLWHAVRNGTATPVYSDYPKKAAASTTVPMLLKHQWRYWCWSW